MRGEVTVADGGTITVENCRLSIAQGAVLRGSVSIGRNGERTMGYTWTALKTEAGSKVRTLVLDGCGEVNLEGDVELIDTTVSNKTRLRMNGGKVGSVYARSDAEYRFGHGTRIDYLVIDGEECTFEKQSYVANVHLHEEAWAGTVELENGFLDVRNGGEVDVLRMNGDYTNCHVFSETDRQSPRDSVVHEAYLYGRRAHLMSTDSLGFVVALSGEVDSHGQADTLVMVGQWLNSQRHGGWEDNERERILRTISAQ